MIFYPLGIFCNSESPPCFKDAVIPVRFDSINDLLIYGYGRILPKKYPYCRASFLIRISLLNDYPLKKADLTFVDLIYHPCVHGNGNIQYSRTSGKKSNWIPKTFLAELIERLIYVIDNDVADDDLTDNECANEYRTDREMFYDKALRMVNLYGRPRY